jgi:hypothetical protein
MNGVRPFCCQIAPFSRIANPWSYRGLAQAVFALSPRSRSRSAHPSSDIRAGRLRREAVERGARVAAVEGFPGAGWTSQVVKKVNYMRSESFAIRKVRHAKQDVTSSCGPTSKGGATVPTTDETSKQLKSSVQLLQSDFVKVEASRRTWKR